MASSIPTTQRLLNEILSDGAPVSPVLFCPIDSALHDEVESCNEMTVAWAKRFGLVTESTMPRLRAMKTGSLAARFHPNVSSGSLNLVADWFTFLCLLDDWVEGFEDIDDAAVALAKIHALSAGPAIENALAIGPVELAAADIFARLQPLASPAQSSSFAACLKHLFDCYIFEVKSRAAMRPLAPALYMPMRVQTSLFPAAAAIGIVVERIELSKEPSSGAALFQAELLEIASNIGGWQNDIFTYEKELRVGEIHNLVVVIAEAEALDLPAAIAKAIGMHDAEVRRFIAFAANGLKSVDRNSSRYAAMLTAYVRGHLDWAHETGRYAGKPNEEATSPVRSDHHVMGDAGRL